MVVRADAVHVVLAVPCGTAGQRWLQAPNAKILFNIGHIAYTLKQFAEAQKVRCYTASLPACPHASMPIRRHAMANVFVAEEDTRPGWLQLCP